MNTIQIMLTKICLKIWRLKFKEVKEYKLKDQNIEIIIFEGNYHYKGQATPFKTIIIDERIFLNYSKTFQDFIVAHEFGHIRFSGIFYLILLPIFFASLCLELFGLLFLIFFLILSIIIKSYPVYYYLISSFIVFLSGLIVTWLSEIDAEFYAIGILGLEKVILALEEGKTKEVKKSISKKIMYRLTHPPDKLTFYLYNKIKKHR